MKVEKKRLNVKFIQWNAEDGCPIWQDWYGCERREWERWLRIMTRRFKGDWKRARLELSWRDGDKSRYVGPKLRKEYRKGLKYRWSREFIEGKINEIVLAGGMPSTNVLSKKLGVHWLTMHRRMREFGIDLKERKPIGLHGRPLGMYVNRR